MRAAVHALALLALLAAVPAHGFTAAGSSAAPAALAAASPALRLRGGGAPKDAGGKVRRAGKLERACLGRGRRKPFRKPGDPRVRAAPMRRR